AGADAIGMVFYPQSPRCVGIDSAKAICDSLPPFVTRVGLFVDADRDYIKQVLGNVGLDMLQFHGSEAEEDCLGYGRSWIKAIRMRPGTDVLQQSQRYNKSAGILVDSYVAGKAGGTGRTFDWDIIPANLARPLILAGGLNPENVQDAIRRVKPYAVDVSGGVESAKGIKDRSKLVRFIEQVRLTDNE
ncbi:MAG: phosphoribosylanthranilate isomerase, partial [Gammaproteobacteria bacterium]